MCDLSAPHFKDEDKAREYLEALRWPHGPVCPHCGSVEGAYAIQTARRAGLYKCKDCRKQFTVTVGTVFERSKIPLTKWLMATYLMCSSKKGISSHQLHRMLGVTYKTAWFMTHRIREAMREGFDTPLGGNGKVVEADETFGNERKPCRQCKLTSQASANADKLLGTPYSAIGSVEGELLLISDLGRPQIGIRDAITGRIIHCSFDSEDLDELATRFHKRISVRGYMKYRLDGSVSKIDVETYRVLRDSGSLPSADDVRGILREH